MVNRIMCPFCGNDKGFIFRYAVTRHHDLSTGEAPPLDDEPDKIELTDVECDVCFEDCWDLFLTWVAGQAKT